MSRRVCLSAEGVSECSFRDNDRWPESCVSCVYLLFLSQGRNKYLCTHWAGAFIVWPRELHTCVCVSVVLPDVVSDDGVQG
mmetsp:Transcript_36585/g.104811  ORF Transcript_36585/g.104811 Transcript_36585/m.104811 type:complete len:81 (+) Transcript_36585:1464-1706(+)